MSAQLAGDHACPSCGHGVVAGVCPFCDRPHGRLRLFRGIWFRPTRALILGVATLFTGSALIVVALEFSGRGPSPGPGRTVPAAPVDRTVPAGTLGTTGPVFTVLGADVNELGQRTVKGFAFVVRAAAGSSDLLTDYDLIVDGYLNGDQTVDLEHGDQTFTATIVAVNPDPQVALLRIQAEFPPFAIGHSALQPNETVIVDPRPPDGVRRAAMVAYSGRGGSGHLTFSVAVPALGSGAPVLDTEGRVVGMAEPSLPFGDAGVGFAIPINAACAAVAGC